MQYKLFAFDLDGTTLKKHNILSKENEAAMRKAEELGVLLVPATGRMKNFMPPAIASLPIRYAITSNGAAVYDIKNDKVLYENLLSSQKAAEIMRVMQMFSVHAEFYVNGNAYACKEIWQKAIHDKNLPENRKMFFSKDYTFVKDTADYILEHKICPEKINLPYVHEELRLKIIEKLQNISGITMTSSVSENLEINGGNCNKGDGLKHLCMAINVKEKEVLAMGDGENDVDMLKFAGLAVTVNNAVEQVKKISDDIVCSCEENGVAQAIEKYIL